MTLRWTQEQHDSWKRREARKSAPPGSATTSTPSPSRPGGRGPVVAPQTSLFEPRSLVLVLPMPPTVNELYQSPTRAMVERGIDPKAKWLTDDQKLFRRTVRSIVQRTHRGPPLYGRLEVSILLYFSNRRRADISNRVKAVEDACTAACVWHDDSQIDREVVERVIISGDETCQVSIREIGA